MNDILDFLACETPPEWIDFALKNQSVLLIDHANCEKKAASTAMKLLYRHTSKVELLRKMSQLAREEILHFQQVVEILSNRGVNYTKIAPSRYANCLGQLIRKEEKNQLIDTLIVGAFIEARSCERFSLLAPELDKQLEKFYRGLLKSEARHFKDYLDLAQRYSSCDINDRIQQFRSVEKDLIMSPDSIFRFHSGIPATTNF